MNTTIKTIGAAVVLTMAMGASASEFVENYDFDRNGTVSMFEYENKVSLDDAAAITLANLEADVQVAAAAKQKALDEAMMAANKVDSTTATYNKAMSDSMQASGYRIKAEMDLQDALASLLGL